MSSKLYVGNLPFTLDNSSLEQLFAAFGTVTSARVITDRFSGRSKGYGFVEMASPEMAEAAIAGLNGKDISGRAISVAIALPRQDGGGSSFGEDRPRRGPGGPGGRPSFRDGAPSTGRPQRRF